MSLRIGIIGCGIVGGSLRRWLEKNTDCDIKVYDPRLERLDDLSGCDICFVSVPVPTKSFKQDLSILEESVERCPKRAMIFVRSSVLPGVCDYLSDKYSRIVCAMPEFLTERQADEDMNRLPLICGYPDGLEKVATKILTLLHECLPGKRVRFMANKEAELAKFAHNCFGAMKVTYFNGIYSLCERLGISYAKVLEGASLTGFIEPTHTMVPGPDGKKGFGGKCFPPNITAFMGYLGSQPLAALMRDVFLLNRFYRGEKDFDDGIKEDTTSFVPVARASGFPGSET